MMELSRELNQRMAEASKDTAWVEKFRVATTWEEYEKLFVEKGIEVSVEMKEVFAANHTVKTGKLADDDMENISGGLITFFDCPKEPNVFLCALTNCPHVHWGAILATQRENYCDLGHWHEKF